MFRAILLLQRERLKEMWWNKVAKTKRQPTSIDFFSIYNFFMIFEIVSKTSKKPIKGVFRAILLLQASCRALPKMLPLPVLPSKYGR